MNKIIFIGFFLTMILPAFGQKMKHNVSADNGVVKISWTYKISADFSFTNLWSYPEGIYKNQYGQLSCDGLCPERTFTMKDSTGRIFTDSLNAFYQLIDTSHLFHSIKCDAWCYEWAGSTFIRAQLFDGDTIKCNTLTNVSTHCSLNLIIIENSCIPTIELLSISEHSKKVYTCSDGYITIDKGYWKNGILKTRFDFNFYHPENPKIKMFWKGIAMTVIEKK